MAHARPAVGGGRSGRGARLYDRKRAGLGDEFLDAVAAALGEIGRDPELPRLYYRSFRRVRLRRFPYKIFYQVIGQRVVVFGVLHAKQEHRGGLD